jgi:hypothetical protein
MHVVLRQDATPRRQTGAFAHARTQNTENGEGALMHASDPKSESAPSTICECSCVGVKLMPARVGTSSWPNFALNMGPSMGEEEEGACRSSDA